jgi:hypothetical protein
VVSTLAPINRKTGFKICFQSCNLHRYSVVPNLTQLALAEFTQAAAHTGWIGHGGGL